MEDGVSLGLAGPGAARAVCTPHVAHHAPGRGAARAVRSHTWHMHRAGVRRVRRACHAWHVRQARGRIVRCASHAWHMRRAGAGPASCGTCTGKGGGECGVYATRGTCPRQSAERVVCMPHVACAPGRGRSVRWACHVWHVGAERAAWHAHGHQHRWSAHFLAQNGWGCPKEGPAGWVWCQNRCCTEGCGCCCHRCHRCRESDDPSQPGPETSRPEELQARTLPKSTTAS